VRDAETGKTVWLDTNDTYTRFQYNKQFHQIIDDAKLTFRNAGADLLQIATGEDYVKVLQQFFIRRA
jgi:hypothetical protein